MVGLLPGLLSPIWVHRHQMAGRRGRVKYQIPHARLDDGQLYRRLQQLVRERGGAYCQQLPRAALAVSETTELLGAAFRTTSTCHVVGISSVEGVVVAMTAPCICT